MALIKSVRGFTPKVGKDCFLADNAVLIGDTVIGDECSIWFGAILRGDVNSIRIGNRVNIQDGSVLHTLYEKSTIEIGDDVSIGHNVTIHGATIHDGALVGMGSVILDHAVVGEGAIVAAGSVVLSKTVIKPGELWGGTPAKFIKMVDPEQSKEINQNIDPQADLGILPRQIHHRHQHLRQIIRAKRQLQHELSDQRQRASDAGRSAYAGQPLRPFVYPW